MLGMFPDDVNRTGNTITSNTNKILFSANKVTAIFLMIQNSKNIINIFLFLASSNSNK